MFPQAKASGIDTVSLGLALLQRRTELLANPGTPPVTGPNGEGGDEQDDLPTDEESSHPKISSARKTHRRSATPKHDSHRKAASHKAR